MWAADGHPANSASTGRLFPPSAVMKTTATALHILSFSVSIHPNLSIVACKGEMQRFNVSKLPHKLLFPAIYLLKWICISTSSKSSRKYNKIRPMMYGRVVRFLSIFCRIFQLSLTLSGVCPLCLAILPYGHYCKTHQSTLSKGFWNKPVEWICSKNSVVYNCHSFTLMVTE